METAMSDTHRINAWCDRQGDLIGAAIFLSPEEVRQLRENGTITIVAETAD